MAYYQIVYFVHDNTNPGIVYKMEQKEAKALVVSGRGSLRDDATQTLVETPQEWLEIVEKKEESVVGDDTTVETSIEELRAEYEEKFGKPVASAYKNHAEWIKGKLYS